MKKNFWLWGMALLVLASCSQPYKKAKDGAEYKLFLNNSGKKAVTGNFIMLNVIAKYKDSVLFNSYESSQPRFIPYDTAQMPEFFKTVHEGDSLVIRLRTDSLIKMGQAAPFMKKGEFLIQYFRIAKVYDKREDAEADQEKYNAVARGINYKKTMDKITKDVATTFADQIKKDDVIIKDYLTKNNLQATKAPWGTYVVITQDGTGPALDKNAIAMVNYTGRTLKDSVFDSNVDPKYGHVEPLTVDMSGFGVIPGWLDGLQLMKKGSKGKLIIPSSLAYGKDGNAPRIGPNEVLLFDMEVQDVLTQEQFKAKQAEREKQMMDMQQKAMQEAQKKAAADSAKKMTPKPDKK
ncbi:MAG: FKBP-type peptidyl-prolyl cis-trans isomerase [Ferruginibacter sp.]